MNRLPGIIKAVERSGSIALIDVAVGFMADLQHCTALLLDADAERFRVGAAVTLAFNETEVALAKDLSGIISLRNRLAGTVERIEQGQLMSRVLLRVGAYQVSSVITTRSLQALRLQTGDAVEGLVKSNEMHLLPEQAA
ncbi:MAG TPA: TOBE domain-containing protein [Burkholderiaceae bacterium]